MRTLFLLSLPALLLACSGEPAAPPVRHPSTEEFVRSEEPSIPPLPVEGTPRTVPAVETEAGDEVKPDPEPAKWREIEVTLRDDPTPDDALAMRDLEASKVSLAFRETPLGEVAERLSGETGRKIELLPVIYEECTAKELLVTLEAGTVTGTEALDRICANKRLVWLVRDGAVKIGPPSAMRPPMVEVIYPVGKIAHEPDAIADLIRHKIRPATWEEGGDVDARRGDLLHVRAPNAVQREILALLRKLRNEK